MSLEKELKQETRIGEGPLIKGCISSLFYSCTPDCDNEDKEWCVITRILVSPLYSLNQGYLISNPKVCVWGCVSMMYVFVCVNVSEMSQVCMASCWCVCVYAHRVNKMKMLFPAGCYLCLSNEG